MAKKAAPTDGTIQSYHYDAKRKNIPPAGLAAEGKIREAPKLTYAYDPHLPPVLRSDPTGEADRIPEIIAKAGTQKLTADEVRILREAIRQPQPWLEWAGKREQRLLDVDPVALHIHERVSAEAILRVAARQDVQRSLFADPDQEYHRAVQFYRHDVDWANRLILGDSLQVMASLARREDLAGKVQMIYMDPPYGIRFASNFQPEIGKRDVTDKESDLTREPEMVKAYRDTWTLGVHSYLAYLRDRLMLCKELLADTGSIFVQISDENLHRVRAVMDEVFGPENSITIISIQKTGSVLGSFIQTNVDFLLWYAKDRVEAESKFNPIYLQRRVGGSGGTGYSRVEETTGARRQITQSDYQDDSEVRSELTLWSSYPLTSEGFRETTTVSFEFQGKSFHPGGNRHWGVVPAQLRRAANAERIVVDNNQIRLVRYWSDSPVIPLGAYWDDVGGVSERLFAVQTNTKVIQRCLLMTTDPGDLVLDPTCGSGTTAHVAEQWGRRWIIIDTSRVALSLARQRILTVPFPFYKVKGDDKEPGSNPGRGFDYKKIPHITLKSIAQNAALDAIFAKHQPVLDRKFQALNAVLTGVTTQIRQRLQAKLLQKERREGKKAVTDADRRRWLLPREGWQEWEVPFDADELWSEPLKRALKEYRDAWHAKMDEINAAISANAEPEELVDQPEVVKGVVRVAGPFTVEAVMPAEESPHGESPIDGPPGQLQTFGETGDHAATDVADDPANADAFRDRMIKLLLQDGVRFPNNNVLRLERLERLDGAYLHAEGGGSRGATGSRAAWPSRSGRSSGR